MENRKRRIGILTAGGDCPGLNAAISRITSYNVCYTKLLRHFILPPEYGTSFARVFRQRQLPATLRHSLKAENISLGCLL